MSNTFQTKADTIVNIGTEVTLGTPTVADSGTWHTIDCTNYNFTEKATAPLEVAPQKSGILTQGTHQAKHAKDKKSFEISLEFLGSPTAIDRMCLAMYGDGDGTNALLGSSPSVKKYEHGTSNAVPVTIYIQQGGAQSDSSDATLNKDIFFTSCMMTGLSFSYGFSDAGALKVTATFITNYNPTEVDNVATLGSSGGSLTTTAGTPLNFMDMSTTTISAQSVLMSEFNANISRSVNIAGYDKANDRPVGYVISPYEVTGSFVCKRDNSSGAINFNDSAKKAIVCAGTSSVGIAVPNAMIENVAVNTADSWKQTVNYRGMYDGVDTATTVISIKTA
tara:strand:+ start:7972 stop:8976 length:1005 start_codon:yes stop_codon:yes gene_type:complete